MPKIRVSDIAGASVSQAYQITVAPDTRAPQVSISFSGNPVEIGATVSIVNRIEGRFVAPRRLSYQLLVGWHR